MEATDMLYKTNVLSDDVFYTMNKYATQLSYICK